MGPACHSAAGDSSELVAASGGPQDGLQAAARGSRRNRGGGGVRRGQPNELRRDCSFHEGRENPLDRTLPQFSIEAPTTQVVPDGSDGKAADEAPAARCFAY